MLLEALLTGNPVISSTQCEIKRGIRIECRGYSDRAKMMSKSMILGDWV